MKQYIYFPETMSLEEKENWLVSRGYYIDWERLIWGRNNTWTIRAGGYAFREFND